MNVEDAQSIIEVQAKLSLGRPGLQVVMGGRDQPHVGLDRVIAPHASSKVCCCSTRKILACKASGMSPISSNSKVPPLHCSNFPIPSMVGSGEGTAAAWPNSSLSCKRFGQWPRS